MVNDVRPTSLDHLALWVDDRDSIAGFLCDRLGMHVIDRTEAFTLVGADARRGKLTLFAAEGPRERGALERIVLRVRDLEAALALLDGIRIDRDEQGIATFEAPGGVPLGVREAAGVDYDLDHIVLRLPNVELAAAELLDLGFGRDTRALVIGDRGLRLIEGESRASERPLLNHLGLLVESVDEHAEEARRRGIEVLDEVDAANTRAIFVRGPSDLRIEYVEHKPGFALQ